MDNDTPVVGTSSSEHRNTSDDYGGRRARDCLLRGEEIGDAAFHARGGKRSPTTKKAPRLPRSCRAAGVDGALHSAHDALVPRAKPRSRSSRRPLSRRQPRVPSTAAAASSGNPRSAITDMSIPSRGRSWQAAVGLAAGAAAVV